VKIRRRTEKPMPYAKRMPRFWATEISTRVPLDALQAYHPSVRIRVPIRKFEEPATVNYSLAWYRTNSGTSLVIDGDILITRALRNKIGTCSMKRPEFIGH
jgi:hypothetical protein